MVRAHFHNRLQQGISLPELMVAITISAIILMMAFAPLGFFISNYQLKQVTELLHSSLMLARSEAITRQHNVVVCPSSDLVGCDNDWSQGWIVYQDQNNNNLRDVDEPLLQKVAAGSDTTSIVWNGGSEMSFNLYGQTNRLGTFTLCEQSGDGRLIIVSMTGRARIEREASCP